MGMCHAQRRESSVPPHHPPAPPRKGGRNSDPGLRSPRANATSGPQHTHTPPSTPQHGESRREPEGHFYPQYMCFGGGCGCPQRVLPSPISLQQLFLSPQGCAARAPRPPHPQPWKCPPAPMIHHFVARAHRALPFPHSTAENQQTGKPRHGKGGSRAGGDQEHTCRKLGAVERGKRNKDLAGITTSIPNTRMLESPRCCQPRPRAVSY